MQRSSRAQDEQLPDLTTAATYVDGIFAEARVRKAMGAVDEDDKDDELAACPVEGGTTDAFYTSSECNGRRG